MKFCIVVSNKDKAGLNIKDKLIKYHGFKKKGSMYQKANISLLTLPDDTIYSDDIDKIFLADLYIFATRHSSAKGVKSLSVHAPGNWGPADYGGREGTLCVAPASYIKEGLKILDSYAKGLDFQITVEQTHHGPILKRPCMFIEIGSEEKSWCEELPGKIIAKTIMELLHRKPRYESTVFLGGGHYNHEVNKILLKTNLAVGHICAKHALKYLDKQLLLQAIDKTSEPVKRIIIDWKGLGEYKQKVIAILDEMEISYEKSKRLI